MTTVNFAYWLQGFFEITGTNTITEDQVKMIKAHLNMVFVHDIDPKMGNQAHQNTLNAIHNMGGMNANGEVMRC